MTHSRWMFVALLPLAAVACSVYTPDLLEGSGGSGGAGQGPQTSTTDAQTSTGETASATTDATTTDATTTSATTTSATTNATTNATTTATTTTGAGGATPGVVWINELHYDNSGADAGEGVEVAGTAGQSLAGWSIVRYNGTGGGVVGTTALSGTIPSQLGGFGTIWFPIAGLENGAPDGLALVDDMSTVVQFLSYEGAFAATAGPANGMMSIDIGVSEEPAPAAGLSLQLTGAGSSYADFMWVEDVPASPDQPNAGQIFN